MADFATISFEELNALLIEADPSVVLAPGQILRRVIRHDRGYLGLPFKVPHKKAYLVSGDALLRLSTPKELGIEGRSVPKQAILLVRPTPEHLAAEPREKVLLEYWRLLFHAR